MTDENQLRREAFDAWLRTKPEARLWNTTDAMFAAYCAALANPAEPFGHFRALPFGWEQCSEHDEGAVALYDRPQDAQPADGGETVYWEVTTGMGAKVEVLPQAEFTKRSFDTGRFRPLVYGDAAPPASQEQAPVQIPGCCAMVSAGDLSIELRFADEALCDKFMRNYGPGTEGGLAAWEQAQQPSGTWVNFDLRDITHTDPGDEPGWVRVAVQQPSGAAVVEQLCESGPRYLSEEEQEGLIARYAPDLAGLVVGVEEKVLQVNGLEVVGDDHG